MSHLFDTVLVWILYILLFSEKYDIWSIDLVINKEYTFVSSWFYKLGSTKQTQTQCVLTWQTLYDETEQTWQEKLPLACSLQACRVMNAQNKLRWFNYQPEIQLPKPWTHQETKLHFCKKYFSCSFCPFPISSMMFSLLNCLSPHCTQSRIIYIFLPQEICFYNKCSHLWECGTNYIFHTVLQPFPTNYHQIYWETFIPKKQRNFKIAKWN